MSTVALISPVASIVRPLIGLGLLATFAMLFKPLLVGLLRAGIMLIKPRVQVVEETERQRVRGILQLTRMARDLDATQPGLAQELRHLAARR